MAMAKLKLAAAALAAVILSPASGYLAVRAVAAGGGAGEGRTSEAPAQAAAPDPRRPVPEAIRAEAVRSPADPVGRPLPLAAAWTCMFILKEFGSPQQKIDTQFWSPAWQLEQIRAGHHILPFLPIYDRVDEDPFRELAALGLPFSLASSQWEADLSKPPAIGLPSERNPNVVTVEGRIEPRVSPFGPLEPWREMGKKVASVPRLQSAQKTYPEPPLVLFISNNEHGKLWWHEAEKERRYLDRYGKGRPDEFKRKVVGDGWIERYKELIAGIRDHLTAPAWKKNMRAVAYDALVGYDAYRWGGWIEYSLYVPGRVEPWPLCWDGASPSYYVFDWNASTGGSSSSASGLPARMVSPEHESRSTPVDQRGDRARFRPGARLERNPRCRMARLRPSGGRPPGGPGGPRWRGSKRPLRASQGAWGPFSIPPPTMQHNGHYRTLLYPPLGEA